MKDAGDADGTANSIQTQSCDVLVITILQAYTECSQEGRPCHLHTHTNTLKQTLDETNRECGSYFGKVIWLGVGACGVLNLVLKIYQFWNTARPRALLQNQYTRELISTQKMSPHHNKNWSRLCQLSPGMRANTRYLNFIRRATRVHPQRTFMSCVFTRMPGELL